MSARQRRARGFTLMEVMIAVAITGLIGGMVTVSFHTGFKAKEEIERDAEYYRMLRAAMERMTREIGAAFVSDRYDTKRYRDAQDRPTNFIGERDRLLFTSFAHQRLYTDAKESDQAVVEYYVRNSDEPGAHDRKDLIRRENPLVQDRMDKGGAEDALFEGIKEIRFEYWDSEKKEWDEEWDTRRAERQHILPTRVRITIVAKDENGKESKYVTQARVMLNTELSRY